MYDFLATPLEARLLECTLTSNIGFSDLSNQTRETECCSLICQRDERRQKAGTNTDSF